MDFNIFDMIIISITLILAIKGYFSGIIREIAGLLGIGVGLYLGSLYYSEVGNYINNSIFKIPNESAVNLVGFVFVFISTWAIIVLIGVLFSKMLSIAKLGLLDRIGGVVFSAGKFFIIVSVIVTMLSQIESLKSSLKKYQKDSLMWPIMNKVGNTLINLKPEEVKNELDNIKKQINDKITKNIKPQIDEAVKKAVEKAKGE
jgi:membrane protein required for colicin V production